MQDFEWHPRFYGGGMTDNFEFRNLGVREVPPDEMSAIRIDTNGKCRGRW